MKSHGEDPYEGPIGRDVTAPAFDVKGYRTRQLHPRNSLLSSVPEVWALG